MPASPLYDRYQSKEGYHAVPLSYTGTFMPPKPDLVFHDAPYVTETVHTAFNVELSPTKPDKDLSQSNRPSAPITEDWVSDSEDESEADPTHNSFTENLKQDIPKSRVHKCSRNKKACFGCKSLTHLIKDCDYYETQMVQKPFRNHATRGNNQHYARMSNHQPHRHVVPTVVLTKSRLVPFTVARPVTATVPQPHVTRPRTGTDTTVKAPQVNAVKCDKGNEVWKLKCPLLNHDSRHTSASIALKKFDILMHLGDPRNMSYLSDFEAINRGYVAFDGNPKGGKII
nr:hypothetical protein [Tanacetum cinerariifolium]